MIVKRGFLQNASGLLTVYHVCKLHVDDANALIDCLQNEYGQWGDYAYRADWAERMGSEVSMLFEKDGVISRTTYTQNLQPKFKTSLAVEGF